MNQPLSIMWLVIDELNAKTSVHTIDNTISIGSLIDVLHASLAAILSTPLPSWCLLTSFFLPRLECRIHVVERPLDIFMGVMVMLDQDCARRERPPSLSQTSCLNAANDVAATRLKSHMAH